MRTTNLKLCVSFLGWFVLYSLLYLSHFASPHSFLSSMYFGLNQMSAYVELGLDAVIIVSSYRAIKLVESKYKKYFTILCIGFVFLAINDATYFFIYEVLKIQSPSNYLNLLYFLPFLAWAILQSLFWVNVLKKPVFSKKNPKLFLALNMLGGLVMLIFVISSSWQIEYFSYTGLYELCTGAIEIVLFYLSALGVICSTNKAIYLLAYSNMLVVATNFWEKYLFQSGTLSSFDYSDPFWCLALILATYGLSVLLKNEDPKVSSWFYTLKYIKSQVTLAAFLFTMSTLVLLVMMGYYFGLLDSKGVISLPFTIMLYSLGTLFISNHVGSKLEGLFFKIQKNIKSFMSGSKRKLIKQDFSIEEFIFLQKFIFKMFQEEDSRNQEKRRLYEVAAQMAHDIRSPVSVILMFSKEYAGLPENQRMLLRNSANRIQSIANNWLKQYKEESDQKSKIDSVLVSEVISSVFSEKEIEHQSENIKFRLDIEDNTVFSFINVDRVEFERVISNLINNAVESLIGDSGEIKLKVFTQDGKPCLKLKDNGVGMTQAVVDKVLSGKYSSKKSGYGLGMVYIKSVLKKYGATFDINSTPGDGTEIGIVFPVNKEPCWVARKIEVGLDSTVLVLDDDPSIHNVWEKIFQPLLKKHPKLELLHYRTAEQCMAYIHHRSTSELKKIVLLSDYELIRQEVTGLDVIKAAQVGKAVLVTSHFNNRKVIKQAILQGTRVLPKILSPDVELGVVSSEIKIKEKESAPVDIVVVDNATEFVDILTYLCRVKNKQVLTFSEPYGLFDALPSIDKGTKIVFDYDLGLPINGVELAQQVAAKGFKNLYLATGYNLDSEQLPPYLTLLKSKMAILSL